MERIYEGILFMIGSKIKSKIIKKLVFLKYAFELKHQTKLSSEKAMCVLKKFYPKEKPLFRQKNTTEPTVDLQIIVPIYNVEKYLDDCICSLLNQKTDFTYRVVVINDGSTDGSGLILEKYKEHSLITTIQQMNSGVSKARNTALQRISGKYVMFVDSDDMLPENSIQSLLEVAYKYDAEIVEGGYQLFNSAEWGSICRHSDRITKCIGNELFGYPWGKIIRNDRLSDFCFPEGFLFEDTVMRTLLYPSCSTTYTIPDIVYYYRDNNFGITRTSGDSPHCIDTFWMMKYCLEERVCRGQQLGLSDFEGYLFACYRNWGRTRNMPLDVQESLFVLSCDLLNIYFNQFFKIYDGKYQRLLRAIERRSFSAFLVIVKNWNIM